MPPRLRIFFLRGRHISEGANLAFLVATNKTHLSLRYLWRFIMRLRFLLVDSRRSDSAEPTGARGIQPTTKLGIGLRTDAPRSITAPITDSAQLCTTSDAQQRTA